MAATIILSDLPTGQSLTVDVYPDGSDTAAASAVALTEATNRKTVYSYSSATLTGLHRLLVKLGSVVIGSRWAVLATTGVIEAWSDRGQNVDVPTAEEIVDEIETRGLEMVFSSPVLPNGEIDIVQGADYYQQDGRDLEWSFERAYTPTSCVLKIASGEMITITSTDITESSGSGSGRWSVRFQIVRTGAQGGDKLESGRGSFDLFSVVDGRQIPEIAEGKATIRRRLA